MKTTMMYSLVLFIFLSTVSSLFQTGLKAPSPYTNCGCQCSSLTFQDRFGQIQGNCRSADHTGARWCYVDSARRSSCQDLHPSARFPNNPWSYEACATPSIHQCGFGGIGGYTGPFRNTGYGK